MTGFPSLNLLRSSSSLYTALDQQTIEKRQQENNAVVSFQHYSTNNKKTNGESSNKRPRAASACDRCKRNKKRCSGDEPCKTCKSKNVACNYLDGGRKEQSETTASKRPTLLKDDSSTATENEATLCTQPMVNFYSNNMMFTQNSLLLSALPPPAPQTPNGKSDTNFSHFFVQKPIVNSFGYFGSTNVFAAKSRLRSSPTTNFRCGPSPSESLSHINLPTLDQHYLLDVYCQHVDTFYPVFTLDYLKKQLHSSPTLSTIATSLNTLFFCALFARAAYLARSKSTSNNLSFGSFSTHFIIYAQCIRDDYLDDPTPTCSTVLALSMMANHLECNRLRHQLPVAWKWAGEACTLALNMGLHAKESLVMDSVLYQLRLRTYWLTFITDYTLKTIHGRPFLYDETEIPFLDNKTSQGKHPSKLQCTDDEGVYTQRWLDRLKATIEFCKGAKKIVKYNYSPLLKLNKYHSPYYRGFLTTMDHWIHDAAKKDDEVDHQTQRQRVQEMTPPVEGVEQTMTWMQRLDRLNDLYFYANAMLLHKRYIEDDTRQKNGSRSVSFEICYQAAEQAIYLANSVSIEELSVLATSPITLYSIVMALQVLGECCLFSKTRQQGSSLPSTAELLFEMGYHALHRLPIFQEPRSMMYDTLYHLWDLYNDYCATKSQKNLSGQVLLRKPISNHSWANMSNDHPFNAFMDSTTVASFMQHLTTTSLPVESASTRTSATKGQEQDGTRQPYQTNQLPILNNIISETACGNQTSYHSLTRHIQGQSTSAPILPSTTQGRTDPEVIPVAGYEGSPHSSFDPSDLTSTFAFATGSFDSYQQNMWAIPTPNSFSSPTFSSSLYSSPCPDTLI